MADCLSEDRDLVKQTYFLALSRDEQHKDLEAVTHLDVQDIV